MKIIILLVAIILTIWFVWSLYIDQDNESPTYIVLERRKKYEIRKYESYIVAEVSVLGNLSNATGRAFQKLGGYIFGANRSNSSIAMTSPVSTFDNKELIAMTSPVSTKQDEDYLTMAFMMPSKFTLDTLPIPISKEIEFREVSQGRFAVMSFSGWVSDSRFKKKTKELIQKLIDDSIEIIGEPQLLQYDRPTKFPLLRRNEIKIQI